MEGRTICALGDAAAMPVRSFVRTFREEFEHYIEHGCSMFAKRPSAA
jgi:NADH-quinone oxidoreductase subunit F